MPVLRILLQPEKAWKALRAADPAWTLTFLRHAAPLSLLPAAAWPIGQLQAGALPASASALAVSGFSTFALSLLSIVLLAAGFYALSGFFDATRAWDRSFALAAYSATPVLLCGALLVVPLLIVAGLGALLYTFALCFLGVQQMLDCAESSAAAFVAGACLFTLTASMATGALCSAAGLI